MDMRVFTVLLLILTIVAGCLSYNGIGVFTETVKLTYAYLVLSTVASVFITLTMRPLIARPVPVTKRENV